MYTFVCTGTQEHTSYSASREQTNPSCPTCGASTHLVDENPEAKAKCGCGGEIKQGVGCLVYLDSDRHIQDAQHEDFMRAGGRGFGTQYSSLDAMMHLHLQNNGLDWDEASSVLEKEQESS